MYPKQRNLKLTRKSTNKKCLFILDIVFSVKFKRIKKIIIVFNGNKPAQGNRELNK